MRGERAVPGMLACLLLMLLSSGVTQAQERGAAPADAAIQPGALMLGLGGSLTVVEGISHVSAAVRGGTFLDALAGLGGMEGDAAYTYLSGIHQLDLEARLTWQRRISGSTAYPFIGAAGGARMEQIGSFSQTRYPLGLDLGVRALVAPGALIELAYRYRRITGDPVADYSEHRLGFGVGVLIE